MAPGANTQNLTYHLSIEGQLLRKLTGVSIVERLQWVKPDLRSHLDVLPTKEEGGASSPSLNDQKRNPTPANTWLRLNSPVVNSSTSKSSYLV